MSYLRNARVLNYDLHPELQDVLMRNGLQAHIARERDGWRLYVQGHDSPMLDYKISQKQMEAMVDWGSAYRNKTAYNTLVSVIKDDFHTPEAWVSAQSANCRVATGLHGYRVGFEEYLASTPKQYMPLSKAGMFGSHFLGWTPRQQEGFHLRRVGDRLFVQGTTIIPERNNGYMRPGELKSGSYGFYWKGPREQTVQQAHQPVKTDVLKDLAAVIQPVKPEPRPIAEAKPYRELVASDVYFSNEKWQECLKSHGIVIDAEAKTVTFQSSGAEQDIIDTLSDEEVNILTSNNIKEVPLDKRLEVLNGIAQDSFSEPITMELLNSKQVYSSPLTPQVAEGLGYLSSQAQAEQMADRIAAENMNAAAGMQQGTQEVTFVNSAQPIQAVRPQVQEQVFAERHPDAIVINGADLYKTAEKGWFMEGRHGREVSVGDIMVTPTEDGKYKLAVVIDGKVKEKEISEKDFNKFAILDDYHRCRFVAKEMDEIKIKSVDGREASLDNASLSSRTGNARVDSEGNAQAVARQMEYGYDNGINSVDNKGEKPMITHATTVHVDGRALQALNENKAWYREIENGREVAVDDIYAGPSQDGKFRMSAVIDGKVISHEISERQFNKFAALDDYHRLKMVSKIFDEVEMKTMPGRGINVLAAVAAGLTIASDLAANIMRPHMRPEIYQEVYQGPPQRIFYKPEVDSINDIAQRAFDAGVMAQAGHQDMGRGR